MKRTLALIIGVATLAGVFLWAPGPADTEARRAMGPTQRLFGPLGSLAASVEWVRFRLALRDGDEERAYAHAHRALHLDARSTSGWETLATHYIFTRGSKLETLTEDQRRRWFQVGFDTLAEGETKSTRPEVLAFVTGLFALHFATQPNENLPWEGAGPELRARSIAAFERAKAGGHRAADDFLTMAQE